MSFNSVSSEDILDLQNIGLKNQSISNLSLNAIPNSYNVKTTWRRWLVLATYSSLLLISLFNLNEYFDIDEAVKSFYDLNNMPSLKQIDSIYWQEIFNLISHGVLLFPALFLIQLKGVWFSCMFGALMTSFGCWFKFVSFKSEQFVFLFTGQLICGVAQSFILTPLAKISSAWFGLNEVATATAVWVKF